MPKILNIHQTHSGLSGTIEVPGDKSISHRGIMLGSIAQGTTLLTNFLKSEDCLCTANAFKAMGINIKGLDSSEIIIEGKGIDCLQEPCEILDMGNSGTSTRLLAGLLAARPFYSVMKGDQSLSRRPMDRIIGPLSQMGAEIYGRQNNKYLPLSIVGKELTGINYQSPIASAQVKSALILAGLNSKGTTTVTEPILSRDHTERMIGYMGGEILRDKLTVSIQSGQQLQGRKMHIPSDISSAAFFMVAALIVPDSQLTLTNVGMNPTRTGLIDVLLKMGASLNTINYKGDDWEPVADIIVTPSELRGIEISGEIIPRIIDEIPIIAVLATQARGTTIIREASELRVKESDRISCVVSELQKMGADITEQADGMIIKGPTPLKGAKLESFGDHRLAMSWAVAGLIADGETTINNVDCITTSFPGFEAILESIRKD